MRTSIGTILISILLLAELTAFSQTNLTVNEFVRVYQSTTNAQLLDVRTPAEWKKGKVATATCVDFMNNNFKKNAAKLDKSKPVFVYCASGGRSVKASEILQNAGFKQVYNLTGGGFSQLRDKGLD